MSSSNFSSYNQKSVLLQYLWNRIWRQQHPVGTIFMDTILARISIMLISLEAVYRKVFGGTFKLLALIKFVSR